MSEKKVLRLHDVMAIVGVRKTTIYSWVKRGEFPAPVRLGARAVGWRESEIGDWLASRIPAGIKPGDIAEGIAVEA